MTAPRSVTVRMLQGMAGELLTLEPGDMYQTTPAQAKIWAEHQVAEIIKHAPSGKVSQHLKAPADES